MTLAALTIVAAGALMVGLFLGAFAICILYANDIAAINTTPPARDMSRAELYDVEQDGGI